MKIKLELILDKEKAQVIIDRAKLKPTTYEECVEQYIFEHIVDNLNEFLEENPAPVKRLLKKAPDLFV